VDIDASDWVLTKLRERNISLVEVEECFFNHRGVYLIDDRTEHKTEPPTAWFIGETVEGRRLKIVFMLRDGRAVLKSAFEPTDMEEETYEQNS
jgi:uncharacterized DUF497 family protein